MSSGISAKIIVNSAAINIVMFPMLRFVRSDSRPTHIATSHTAIKITRPIPTPKITDVMSLNHVHLPNITRSNSLHFNQPVLLLFSSKIRSTNQGGRLDIF